MLISIIIGIRAMYEGKACNGPCLETHRGCAEVNYSQDAFSPCFQAIDDDQVIKALKNILKR